MEERGERPNCSGPSVLLSSPLPPTGVLYPVICSHLLLGSGGRPPWLWACGRTGRGPQRAPAQRSNPHPTVWSLLASFHSHSLGKSQLDKLPGSTPRSPCPESLGGSRKKRGRCQRPSGAQFWGGLGAWEWGPGVFTPPQQPGWLQVVEGVRRSGCQPGCVTSLGLSFLNCKIGKILCYTSLVLLKTEPSRSVTRRL